MAKLYSTDMAAAMTELVYRVRLGMLKIFSDNVAIVLMPDKIHVEGEMIIKKDFLDRIETSSRDATIVTTTSGTSTEQESVTGFTSLTSGTSVMDYSRAGTEVGSDVSGETGGQSGGQSGSADQGGGESEYYTYETDS